MNKRIFALLLAALLLLTASGCSKKQAFQEQTKSDILATTQPVYQLASALTDGTGLSVSLLISEPVSCLHDYTLTVAQMAEAMVKAAEKVYGLEAKTLSETDFDEAEIEKRYQRFSSFDWNYGKSVPCSFECAKRFAWGEVTIQLAVKNGLCEDAAVYSDAMDAEFAAPLAKALTGCRFHLDELCACVKSVSECAAVADDLCQLLQSQEI